MYMMRKMNREKKAATDAERAALLADGYRDVTPPALHENAPAGTVAPVNPGKVPAGEDQDPIKKLKAADTRQKKTVSAAGPPDQGMAETEKSKILENTGSSESTQKESVEEAAGPVQEQPPATS